MRLVEPDDWRPTNVSNRTVTELSDDSALNGAAAARGSRPQKTADDGSNRWWAPLRECSRHVFSVLGGRGRFRGSRVPLTTGLSAWRVT